MGQMQTPSTVHVEFDHMCALLEDFEHIPSPPAPPFESEPERERAREENELNQLILAGLVSPL